MESDSSSSSDEEANDRLRAAASEELTAYMKNEGSGGMQGTDSFSEVHTKAKKSIRQELYADVSIQDTVANTTPEFRAHVAKKLTKYFDEILVNKKVKLVAEETQTEVVGGVKLLSDSLVFVGNATKSNFKPKPDKHIVESSDSESDNEELSSVVVSGDDILKNAKGAYAITNP